MMGQISPAGFQSLESLYFWYVTIEINDFLNLNLNLNNDNNDNNTRQVFGVGIAFDIHCIWRNKHIDTYWCIHDQIALPCRMANFNHIYVYIIRQANDMICKARTGKVNLAKACPRRGSCWAGIFVTCASSNQQHTVTISNVAPGSTLHNCTPAIISMTSNFICDDMCTDIRGY